MKKLKLGLIGVGIENSRSPMLQKKIGQLCGLDVSYDLINLRSSAKGSFNQALSECKSQEYHGVNITHPFKENAAKIVTITSNLVKNIAAVNIVKFNLDFEDKGYNSDYTGFKRAFVLRFPGQKPRKVALIGAGGIGRAIAFGLADLGAEEIRVYDQDYLRSQSLVKALNFQDQSRVFLCNSLEDAIKNVNGLVNATPVGMHNHLGTPIPKNYLGSQSWVFDAVYTPIKTTFLLDASEAGLEILSGFELFFYQGIEAFEIFSGVSLDESQLRKELFQNI